MDKYGNNNIVFGKEWFEKHQGKLLFLLNNTFTKRWFRYVMRILECDLPINEKINHISPNSFTYRAKYLDDGRIELTTDFRTHDKFSKRLYFAFKPMWWMMHALDWIALDRVPELTKLSFGFTTLTQYPGSNGSDDPVDGHIINSGATYSTVRSAGTGTTADYTDTRIWVRTGFSASTYYVYRGYILFDTSSITSGATISSAVQSFVIGMGDKQETNAGHAKVHIVSSTPASTTALATSDYGNVGSTSYGSIVFGSLVSDGSTYNDITLDSNGRANVSKTGISKFGYRVDGDLNNGTPTGTNGCEIRSSNNSGTSTDPKLVVVYSTVVGPANLKSYNTNLSANIKSINTNLIANVKSLDTNV